jgi:hypothetical protein
MVPSLLCIFPLAQCLFKHNNPLVEYAKDTTFVDSREFGRWTIILHPTPLGDGSFSISAACPRPPTTFSHTTITYSKRVLQHGLFWQTYVGKPRFVPELRVVFTVTLASLIIPSVPYSLCVLTSETMMFLKRTNNKLKEYRAHVHPVEVI